MTLDDLPFEVAESDPTRPPRPPRKHRHEWDKRMAEFPAAPQLLTICKLCGRNRDDTLARRGRNNRRRGNDIEREVAAALGLRRVGQFGAPEDAAGEMFVASVKSGSGYFSERYWDQLKRMTASAMQTRLLVVTDAPGPGHRRRAMVVLDLDDWRGLHGRETP